MQLSVILAKLLIKWNMCCANNMICYRNVYSTPYNMPESDREAHEWEKLREAAAMYYPEAKEKASWKVQDCFSLDGIPYIGSYASERRTQ